MKKGLEAFSERIKTLREEKGLKQSDMGALLGCTTRNYQRIEHGDINIPATTLISFADYFGVTTDYLLGRSDQRNTAL